MKAVHGETVEVCAICELPPPLCVKHPGVPEYLTHTPGGAMITKTILAGAYKRQTKNRAEILLRLGEK